MSHGSLDLLGGLADRSVRRAGPTDADAIAAVQRRSWIAGYPQLPPPPPHAEVADQWRAGLTVDPLGPPARAWVACTGTTVVGVALLDPAPAPTDEADLSVLDVDPAHQRQGHGSRLLAAVVEDLITHAVGQLSTWVVLDDVVRVEFFRSAGFAPDGARLTVADEQGRQARLTRLVTSLAADLVTDGPAGPGG